MTALEHVVAALAAGAGEPVESRDVSARPVADGVVLVSYAVPGSLRSSPWRRGDDGWRVLFHQGTPVS
jgi:hypothetical protein